MKIKTHLIAALLLAALLLAALVGQSYAHEDQQDQIDDLFNRVEALLWKTEVLRMHRHGGCMTPENRDFYLAAIRESYEAIGFPQDIIEVFVTGYGQAAKVCGEETDITFKNANLSKALILQSRLMRAHKTIGCYKRKVLNSALAEIRKDYEESEILNKEDLEEHMDWLRRTTQICGED